MKLNRKIIIPAATLLIGVALAGSATSTIAWYQYSTKTNVAYLGTSAGTSGNLLVRIKGYHNEDADGGWKTYINQNDVSTFLGNDKEIKPITPGKMGKNEAIPLDNENKQAFYSNPVYDFGPISQWEKASDKNYVQLPLQFKFVERDGTKDDQDKFVEKQKVKDLYLSDLLIQNDWQNTALAKRDLSSAIRVHFESYQDDSQEEHLNRLVSKGGDEVKTVDTLDLNNDTQVDKHYDVTNADQHAAMYGFGEHPENYGKEIYYGSSDGITDDATALQKSYAASGDLNNGILNVKLGQTSETKDKYLNVVVTIWVEGWQKLAVPAPTQENPNATTLSSIWSEDFIGSIFDVGMQFEAKNPNA